MTDYIAEIKNRMRIADLCARLGLEISRTGHVKSIYKEDKTPSMYIYQETNTFHDFSTGKSGDVIDLYMDFYRLDKSTAIKELAKICGIEGGAVGHHKHQVIFKYGELYEKYVRDMSGAEKEKFMSLIPALPAAEELDETRKKELEAQIALAIMPVRKMRLEKNKEVFREFYKYCNSLPMDAPFFNYLVNTRRLDARTILRHKLFYITDYHRIGQHLKKVCDMGDLKRSGLFNEEGNLTFYKHRIIIPYLFKGEIVYLRGRYFDENNEWKTDKNKYIGLGNDSLDLNRTKRFFNTDVTRTMLAGERLYIVEGEFDAIALESIGYNAVAIPGASTLPDIEQFKKLCKYNLTICGDSDQAGKMLIEKLSGILLSLKKEFSIKELPNKDINDFITA